ncbi:hypothetical protein AALB52_04780 [Lachnospiraceae bacterium 38-14]|uniref:hypothetical protein n=1 Tax=Roseburia sp. 1XD42-69 TaxID=2320088 RepID=UPI000EA2DC3E|nr:hypothetical protein [Roseburia sp. 1XD42-69]RKJ68787.1 hypothetical protein D7Y06_00605 [Roseburia sp. 1XD42-69]
MDYVIKNHKNLYIRLNKNGTPVTCAEHEKTLFEQSKAKNILSNLPKTLKKLNFIVEAIPDIQPKEILNSNAEKCVIEGGNYIVSDQIKQWVEKFGICDDILKEAQKRKKELNKALSEIDKEFINIIHEIEFEGKIDLYGGWQERNRVKENREKRRYIKNEMLVLSSVLKMDFRNLDRNTIDKVVTGLTKRKFTYRVVEEEETESVV